MIEVRKLTKNFATAGGGLEVLRGIDLGISQGERVGLVGANGCGKTSLFRLLLGDLEPALENVRRSVELDPADLDKRADLDSLRLYLGLESRSTLEQAIANMADALRNDSHVAHGCGAGGCASAPEHAGQCGC